MKFVQLSEKLNNEFFPLLYIYGEDAYLRSRAQQLVIQSLNIEYPEINLLTFEQGASYDEIITACETVVFCSAKKAVVVKGTPPDLRGTGGAAGDKLPKSIQKVAKYIDDPYLDCCLIFNDAKFCDYPLSKSIMAVDCNKLSREEVSKWVKARVAHKKRTVSQAVATAVADFCLLDMSRVYTETEKLLSYAAEGEEITLADVNMLVNKDAEYVVYDLSNSIGAKDKGKTLNLLDQMLQSGQKPKDLFRMLYRFYRRLFYVSITKGEKNEIAANLGVKEYALTMSLNTAKLHTPVGLKKAMDIFYSYESRGAVGNIKGEELQTLVLQLLNL